MKKLIVSLFTLVFGAGILADDVEAARLGGGRSLGAQRQITAPPRQATPPTQQQPATAPQPSGPGRWFAPLAGLAAGLGLGWLFAQGGFGAVASALLMALLAGAVVFALMRVLSKQRTRGPQAQYAGFGNETVAAPPPSQLPGDAGVQPNYRSQFVSNIPAGFDVEAFLKEARRNFERPRRPRAAAPSHHRRHVQHAEGRRRRACGSATDRRRNPERRALGARHRG